MIELGCIQGYRMQAIKVINWQTKQKSQMPRIGEDNWINWLIDQGYDIIDSIRLGHTLIDLYKANSDIFAVYHPFFAGLDTECLFVNISTETEARELMTTAQQTLEAFKRLRGF